MEVLADNAAVSIKLNGSSIGAQTDGQLSAIGLADNDEFKLALARTTVIFSCGAAGATLLSADQLAHASLAKVAIDLNAVPPAGIEGIVITDKAIARGARFDYGAIGVGGLKMQIHRESILSLFTRNDLFLDAEEIYAVGEKIENAARA